MPVKCEHYRDGGLVFGLRSPQGVLWRRHSAGCPPCAREIRMLELLQEDATEQRQHLPRQAHRAIVQVVENPPLDAVRLRRGLAHGMWAFCWRAAVLAILLAGIFALQPFAWRRQSEVSVRVSRTPAVPFAEEFQVGADGGRYVASAPVGVLESPVLSWPELRAAQGTEVSSSLHGLRRSVERQRQSLERLIDRELNGDL